jgi:xylulokinase
VTELLLGIDLGSTATKVLTLDGATGQVLSLRQAPCPRSTPSPGRLEVDAEALFIQLVALVHQLPRDERSRVVAIGVAGQMMSLVLIDNDGRVLAPGQSIFDARCADEVEALNAWGPHLLANEGNRALTIHTLGKLMWFARHEPHILAKAYKFLLLKDYVRGQMTGVWATDPSDASGTLLYNQRSGSWDVGLMGDLGLSPKLCPPLIASSEASGSLLSGVARRCGLASGLPVATGAADMAAVQVGVGAELGDTIVSIGTAAHVIVPTREFTNGLWPVQQYTAATPGSFYKFGAVFSGGLALDWFRSLTGATWQDANYSQFVERDSRNCPLFMPYLLGAGSPHYRPGAAAAFTGLRLADNGAALAAAVVDGLVFEVAGIIERLQDDVSRVHLTGGASRLPLIASALAAVLDRPLERTVSTEAAAIGAARLGESALYRGKLTMHTGHTVTVQPDSKAVAFYRQLRPRYEETARVVREF